MAKVEWVKMSVDMFDNKKIRKLRRLPEGNNIILIWVMLLTMAGKCNAGGMIMLTENIPYATDDLADELGFPETTVKLAIASMEQLGMVSTDEEGFLTISGWEEHQNVEAMDKIREQNRIRKQKQRENERMLQEHCDSHVTVTECHATDKIREEREEIREDTEGELYTTGKPAVSEPKKEPRHKMGEYGHVLMSDREKEKLEQDFGEERTEQAIQFLDEYIEMKGYKAKNHSLCIRKWVFDAMDRDQIPRQRARPKKSDNPFFDYLQEVQT